MIEVIERLFKLENIKYVVSVDDCFSKHQVNNFRQALYADAMHSFDNVSPVLASIGKTDQVDNINEMLNLDIDVSTEMSSLIDSLSSQEAEGCYNTIHPNQSGLSEEQKIIIDFLEELKASNVIKKYITVPSTHEATKIDLNAEEMTEGAILWLIDKNFRNVDESESAGIEFAKSLVCEEQVTGKPNNYVFILATINYDSEEEEDTESQFDKILSESNRQTASFIYYISKDRIKTNQKAKIAQSFAYGFKRKLCYELANSYIECLKDACDKAETDFHNINQRTLNYVFADKVQKNGESCFDFFARFARIFHEDQYQKLLSSKLDEISANIDHYQQLCKCIPENIGDIAKAKEELSKIRRKELFDMHINRKYSEISSGDIFKNADGEYYILVTQPCDTYLRKDGKRKLEKATLLKVEDGDSGKYRYDLSCFVDCKQSFNSPSVAFQSPKILPFEVLDLCVVNIDGLSSIDISMLDNSSSLDYNLSLNYKNRLTEILALINEIKKNKAIVDNQVNDDTSQKNEVVQAAYSALIKIDPFMNSFNIQDSRLSYSIQRIARLNELYTVDLLKEYGNTLSRVGQPFDFLKD